MSGRSATRAPPKQVAVSIKDVMRPANGTPLRPMLRTFPTESYVSYCQRRVAPVAFSMMRASEVVQMSAPAWPARSLVKPANRRDHPQLLYGL